MKLDKMQFAKLVAYISGIAQRGHIDNSDVEIIDDMIYIDIDVPNQQIHHSQNSDIEKLMNMMAQGTQKIEAIKMYRNLTGCGLKESKDAVERYWKASISRDLLAQKIVACFYCTEDRAYTVADQIMELHK